MKTRAVPEQTRLAQLKVSDPAVSAWVSANAGSGKTYVLSRRVIRLLLNGVPPSRILCLTFTKAAAAHMANEVLKTLREWVVLSDAELDKNLQLVDPAKPSAGRREAARRLFATALETPGGLKVQTIHAFCDRVLHQFPFEAGVPAGFDVLDEAGETDLLNRARSSVLIDAARDPESEFGKALAQCVSIASDTGIAGVFDEIVRSRRKLQYLLDPSRRDQVSREISNALGLRPTETLSSIEREVVEGGIPRSEWKRVAELLLPLAGNAKARGEGMARAAAAEDRQTSVECYFLVFFTDGGPRVDGQFGAANLRDQEPILQRLVAERDRLVPLLEKYRAASALDRTVSLNALGGEIISRYEAMKRARGALDYDDLIAKTGELLRSQSAAWVQYKLDGGIDHILIDEAQDTSPEQWSVIESLTTEFFAGKGASEGRNRTIFAVGDEKQSIFRFQGADPGSFELMRTKFHKDAKASGQALVSEKLELSFRSATGVLATVDKVFSRPHSFRGLSSREGESHTIHEAIRRDAPAQVEVWDPVSANDEGDVDLAWDAPLDQRSETSAAAKLGRNIAKAIKYWLDGGISIGDPQYENQRAPGAGEIIVLVRRRGGGGGEAIRALKVLGVPVAGADRLELAEHIAVMDIAALCDALLLESDDLALACALKSPLFSLDEDDLYKLAYGRKSTLRISLKVSDDPKFRTAEAKFSTWQVEARHLRPFDFLSRVLGRDKGRERFLSRLGSEAADALDELLSLALAYEAVETPTLQGFLVFLRRGGSQIKRDLEVESSAVRVMTVHGVKGLEAPIIVLADTTSVPDGRFDPALLEIGEGAVKPLVWALSGKLDCRALAVARENWREKEREEQRRLLYVALTRARDAVVVCGALSKRQPDTTALSQDCWYRLVRDALEEKPSEFVEVENTGYGFPEKVWRWRFQPGAQAEKIVAASAEVFEQPAWLSNEIPATRPFKADEVSISPTTESAISRRDARRQGELVHRLLQELPAYQRTDWRERAKKYLADFAGDYTGDIHDRLVGEALGVLDHPELELLFGAGSHAEVPIAGKFGDVAFEDTGRLDRLAILDDAVWLADFKSDRIVPARPDLAPRNYVHQLARYRAMLQRVFPKKTMRVLLVWTAGPAVHEIPSDLLDQFFKRFTSV